jgi:hypothetical protein
MEQPPEEKSQNVMDEKLGLETGKDPKSNEGSGNCGCHCHRFGGGMRGCRHCGGFWKGFIVGLALFALVTCLFDHFCGRNMGRCYNGMPMMQNQEPSAATTK